MTIYGDINWLESYTKVFSGVIGIFFNIFTHVVTMLYIFIITHQIIHFKKFVVCKFFLSKKERMISPIWTENKVWNLAHSYGFLPCHLFQEL